MNIKLSTLIIIALLIWFFRKNRGRIVSEFIEEGESCASCVDRLLEDRNFNPETALDKCQKLGCI